jgi:hypothetical protein
MKRGLDVTAVVLSIGEPTTTRAVESVKRQTLPIDPIVLVRDVHPFHRALNQGMADVATPFFIQVDADMVLDPDCVERLAACLTETVGMVTGLLRDPLYERVEAIKLFRTACVRRRPFRDSPSPDTDFAAEMTAQGWVHVYALRYHGRRPAEWHTFGDHDPGYTPLYTYAKHVVEGRRWRYRRSEAGLRNQLQRLHASTHEAALMATIALAQGVFLEREGDLLDRYQEDPDFRRLQKFLGGDREGDDGAGPERVAIPRWPRMAFRRYCELGIRLGRDRRARRFQRVLRRLGEDDHPWSWLARVGLCRGLFLDRYDSRRFADDWTTLRTFGSLRPAAVVARVARDLIERRRQ